MANAKQIYVNGELLNLKQLSEKFGSSYLTVKRYYAAGLRGNQLVDKLNKKQKGFIYNNRRFNSKHEAAKYYGIPKSTFYKMV